MNSYEGEKTSMQKEVANLTSKLVDAKSYLCDLEEENVSYYTPRQNEVLRGYTVFTLSVRPSVRPSVTFCFFNILKTH